MKTIIQRYTREAGVRELERQIANTCRKVARRVVAKRRNRRTVVSDKVVSELLGPEPYSDVRADAQPMPGVAIGLAWTWAGGDILSIETSVMRGKGVLMLTGQLGDVMKESAQAAYSYLRAHAKELRIPAAFYRTCDLHLHVPEGAIPKDGPSAGIPLAVSMVSALRGRAPIASLAMTGEITLRGRVLPVGGVKEKVLAAHRAGIGTVIMPKENEKDLREIPKEIQGDMRFIFVDEIGEAFRVAFGTENGTAVRRRRARPATARNS
jgi:ATP-dependent Lon protease